MVINKLIAKSMSESVDAPAAWKCQKDGFSFLVLLNII